MKTLHITAIGIVAGIATLGAVHSQSLPTGIHGEDSGSFQLSRTSAVGTPTRAEVATTVQQARASGELGVWSAEDSGSFHLARVERSGGPTRAQVEADVLAARASGELDALAGEDSGSFHLAQSRPASVTLARPAVMPAAGCGDSTETAAAPPRRVQ